MIVKVLSIYRLDLPFSLQISHHLASRGDTEGIIVGVDDEEGSRGYGEGTPRAYVTGESLDGALRAAAAIAAHIVGARIESLADLIGFLGVHAASGTAVRNPSAWSALELALLDLWGKREGRPLWGLFTEGPVKDLFVYSAVLPLVSRDCLQRLIELIAGLKMRSVKIKIDREAEGLACARLVREALGPEIDIRVDANAAFSAQQAIAFLSKAAPVGLTAFEQPVAKNDLEGLKRVTDSTGVVVMADESLCTMDDAMNLIAKRACGGFNIRISKCGGFLKSLALWGKAHEHGLQCQIGCHVGETAILSAAGRHLAALCPNPLFLEGSFSKYILREDIVKEDISFGPGGEAPLLRGPGLGVVVEESRLARYATLVARIRQ